MNFSLRELEARLEKTLTITTSDIETKEGDLKGMYVWRDKNGEGYFWSPTPVRYGF